MSRPGTASIRFLPLCPADERHLAGRTPSGTVLRVFWWYWSVRRRLLALAVVLLPLLVFGASRLLVTSSDGPQVAPPTTEEIPTDAASVSDLLVFVDDDSRSASSVFPLSFSNFGDGVTQATNVVLPGLQPDEYAFYVFVEAVPAGARASADPAAPASSETAEDPTGEDAATTSIPSASPTETTAETVIVFFRDRFKALGASVQETTSRTGVELVVIGVESNRGYRTTLRFREVPGGVVVTGGVREIAANEAADAIGEAAPTVPDTVVPGDADGTTTSTEDTGDAADVSDQTGSTVPSTGGE